MGTYSDNQPDYTWNKPFSAKKSAMVLYPIKEMSNVTEANEDLSLNLEINENNAIVEINASVALDYCRMLLKDQEVSTRYLQAGFYREAAEILQMALESGHPVLLESPMIHYYLGYAYKMLGESADYFLLALVNLLLNNNSTAETYLRETLKIDPSHVGANNYFNYD